MSRNSVKWLKKSRASSFPPATFPCDGRHCPRGEPVKECPYRIARPAAWRQAAGREVAMTTWKAFGVAVSLTLITLAMAPGGTALTGGF